MRPKIVLLVLALSLGALVAPAHAGKQPGLFQRAVRGLRSMKEHMGQRLEITKLKVQLALGGLREGDLRTLRKRTFYMGSGKERRERTIMEVVKGSNGLRLAPAVQVRFDRTDKGSYGSVATYGGRRLARHRNREARIASLQHP